jgi:AAA domain
LLEQSYGIIRFLKSHFDHPVHADSGNGYHLEYALASLAPEIGHQYHETILKIIKARFERPDLNMAIDTSISNHTRVITVWGTWNRKYPHTEERPQRQTKILSYPRTLRPLSENRLDGFCLENKVIVLCAATGAAKTKGDWPLVDPQWLGNYGVEHLCEWGLPYTPVDGNYEKGGETHYRLGNCITSDKSADGFYEHHEGSNKRHTELILGKTLGVKCFSDDCDAFTIKDWPRRLQELKGEKYPHRIFKDDSRDLADLFGAEDAEEAAAVVEPLEDPIPPAAEPPNSKEFEIVRTRNKDGSYTGMIGIMASDIQERPVEWLWKGRLPVGCGMVVSGPVACNKSTACVDFVARVTTGRDWPDGAKNLMGPRKVLICAAEDDWETTIKPRLMAAGADCSKIISFVNCFDTDSGGKPVSRALQLEKDTRNLYNMMVAHPDLLMVVLDPLSGFYGDMDGNDSKRIRPMMQAVAKVCRKTRTAILMIIHENKKSDVNAVDKMLGSGAVSQVIRAGLRVSLNPRNKPHGRLMASIKNSMGKPSGGMYFEIGSRNLTSSKGETLEEICYIEWGERHDMSADDAMDDARALKKETQEGLGGMNPDSKTGIAMKIFSDALANGKRLHRDVHALLDAAGVTVETRKDARRALKVQSSKSAPWYWWLPGKEEEAPHTDVPESKMPDVEVM